LNKYFYLLAILREIDFFRFGAVTKYYSPPVAGNNKRICYLIVLSAIILALHGSANSKIKIFKLKDKNNYKNDREKDRANYIRIL
jgi:CelD/BcsL family acetyltransferase involved in cellulose biosynthesis